MINSLFADTFYFIALLDEDDAAHQKSIDATNVESLSIVTTSWIIVEAAAFFAAPPSRSRFIDFYTELRRQQTIIVPPNRKDFEAGFDLYSMRPDKGWSLTDCISFVVMGRMNIAEALTGDHHFEQAGYVALLK